MTRTSLILGSLGLLLLLPLEASAETLAERWHRKVRQFAAENQRLTGEKDIVLFGSSSMEGWKYAARTRRFLPAIGHRTLNRGISGDGTGVGKRGILNRVNESVIDARPKFVFIFNGRNSVGIHGPQRTAEAYDQVIQRIQAALPDTTIVIITCPPTRGRYGKLNNKIVLLNAEYRKIAQRRGTRLLDIHPRVVDSRGRLKSSLTKDGLHFTSAGYAVLGRMMEQVVAFTERMEAEREAVAKFLTDAEELLARGTLSARDTLRLEREVRSRRRNPNRCFEHQTVEAFLKSGHSAGGITDALRRRN